MFHLPLQTRPVHILAVGSDTEMMSRLLQFGQRFADRSTSLTTGHSLTGHVTQDKYRSAQYFVEGRAILLQQYLVCR